MNVQQVKIEKVKPYDKNPRKNKAAVDYVANSIKEFGFQQPIVVDKDMVVIAGHTRLKAAKKLKLKEVPVVIADNLTEEQVKAYRLADNKTAEKAEWDFDLLTDELLSLQELDFDMEQFGFDFDFGEDEEAVEDDNWEADVPEEPISKRGDIWVLGRHDIVLDLFGGSGTTIMAAEQNGRRGFVMEYDPKFVDVIVDRWEQFTGMKAKKIN